MASELDRRWQHARRSVAGAGRHALAAATRGPGRLAMLARQPPMEVRPLDPGRLLRLRPPTGIRLRARGVVVHGLRIDRVDVRAHQLGLRPGVPTAVRAGWIAVGARLTEADVNTWLATAHLPVRLRFTEEGIRARTGLGGVALGSVDVTVALDEGQLRLAPRRVAVLGIQLGTAGVPSTALPLPPLPRAAQLTSLVTAPRTLHATLQLPGGSWDLGVEGMRGLLEVARAGRFSLGAPRHRERVGKTPNAVRMVSL